MVKVTVKCRASTVVEMAYLMQVVLLVWVLVIFALFYYHDKNIVAGAAYETAVVGSELYHEEKKVMEDAEERISGYFQNRIRGKLIFFSRVSVEVRIEKERIQIRAGARKRGMTLSVEKGAALTIPEEEIRKRRVLKQLGKDWLE